MNNVYEISVWDDVYDQATDSYKEKKLLVIGSNTMTSQARARNPNLVTKMDGTVTLNFDLYYRYIDLQTGEEIRNPYVPYLVNERKVKALWKGEWYDLLVKEINEDSTEKVFSYSCESAFVTELSRTGFSLEFQTELQNNIGTAEELIETVLDGSGWTFQPGDTIYQSAVESVFEAITTNQISGAVKEPNGGTYQIPSGSKILVFYSNFSDKNNLPSTLSFYYTIDNEWQKDGSSMEVINGNSYQVDNITWQEIVRNGEVTSYTAKSGNTVLVTVNVSEGLSTKYAAKHYINSQATAYSKLLNRYVKVYEDGNDRRVWGYETIEFTNPLDVVNLIANSNNFADVSSWIGDGIKVEVYPTIGETTQLATYDPISYLYVQRSSNTNHYLWNSGITANKQYIEEGFGIGEAYIFRIKARNQNHVLISTPSLFTPRIATRSAQDTPDETYFSVSSTLEPNDGYLEYRMICQKASSNEKLGTTLFNDLFAVIEINTNGIYYFEDVQFFKEVYGSVQIEENNGVTTEQRRINPKDMDMQGVSKTVWKYYYASKEEELLNKDSLEYDYISTTEWAAVTPVYNAYEKTATIEVSQSNRFNILQDIAEKFQCWIRFIIEHNEDGSIKEDSRGNLCKYVTLLRENGKHTGVNFNYGVDLQGIKRNLKSSNIATKTIVLQNDNEFGQNGFCTIARSPWNYTKENVIYNFDYYISQGLLDEEQLNKDLYEAPNGYFYILHKNNGTYDEITDIIIKKNTEYSRVFSSRTLCSQYLTSAESQCVQTQNNLMRLANVNSWGNALSYAKSHSNNTKVQTLLNSYYSVLKDVEKYQAQYSALDRSLGILDSELTVLENKQAECLRAVETAHTAFYRKYSRFIQEGVWNSEDYYDDNKYYLDAISVAYESSRPQIEYDISIVRLSDLDEYSSKVFDLGDICTIQDIKYFGYQADGITPHKEQVFISEITSFFDTPDKDTFKVQNYKSNFDDLFQRITATTQSLEFSEGKYARAAGALNSNGTIKYSVLQDTFDKNKDLVMGSLNDSVLIDSRGITVTNEDGGMGQVRITSGGIFVTEDGGATWKNAVRGDGISADVLTAGQINTEQISIYGSDAPSFVWDDKGISAYLINANTGVTNLSQYVRFDKYGLYGIFGNDNFVPQSENDVYRNASFGLTWNRFFMKNSTNGVGDIEISSDNDILVHGISAGGQLAERVRIGRLYNANGVYDYGILIRDNDGDPVFYANSEGVKISGNVYIGDFTVDQIVDTVDSVDDAIVGDTLHYLATSASSGVTTETSGWDVDTEMTPVKRYLWIYHTYQKTNGTTYNSSPMIYGVYGESSINVVIDSSAGNLFYTTGVTTTLTCTVYQGTTDITNQVTKFTWKKKNADGTIDQSWSRSLGGRAITIEPNEVDSKAIFVCEVEF